MILKKLTALLLSGLFACSQMGLAWAGGDEDEGVTKAELQELRTKMISLEKRLSEAEAAGKVRPMPEIAAKAAPKAPGFFRPAGVWTEPTTKDMGEYLGVPWLAGTKIRGWVSTYYVYNFNNPSPDRNTITGTGPVAGSSTSPVAGNVVKSRFPTIEGRAFDTHHNSFTLEQAELELEKVPDGPGGIGFKVDLAAGDTQEIITDTIRGSFDAGLSSTGLAAAAGNGVAAQVGDLDKILQHATISYVAPMGRGLRIDAGKMVTHIGGETIEHLKNWNFSHGLLFTYAIPFQQTGVKFNYPWSDTFYTDVYLLNGWNGSIDSNRGKAFGGSYGWVINPKWSWYANYLVSSERNYFFTDATTGATTSRDVSSGLHRNLVDTQVMYTHNDKLRFMLSMDMGHDNDVPTLFTEGNVNGANIGADATWWGMAWYAKYKVNDRFDPALRVEYYSDKDGFTTNVTPLGRTIGIGSHLIDAPRHIWSYTLTGDYLLGKPTGYTQIMLRPEIRYDISNDNFFSDAGNLRNKNDQLTAGMAAVWYF